MNKTQLIAVLAAKTDLSKNQSKLALETILATIVESLTKGDIVQLVGFGAFKVNYRNERIGRNPQTGMKINIPATKIPAFVPGKILKNAIK
ncbi:DNA-binding protein HU-alpha [Candidatus Profftia lariciata]|uniref:HU family DNA-binding protein n=1 Tax=Candidatus Profftia lariciata TaxID=1987921 RepID=UPI001D025822|nr:HU family DNA-binding protein [Candidatus Profftia lariciata]UDG81271.1 DNA-binding protein HU-alpha [Candidatus Profftia lariciata]